jgi:hypothetical protein
VVPEAARPHRKVLHAMFEVNREYLPGWPVGELALRGQ